VENIAQTCAARTGFKQLLDNGALVIANPSTVDIINRELPITNFDDSLLPPKALAMTEEHDELRIKKNNPDGSAGNKIKIGVIGMINMLEITRCPLVGEVLKTSMEIEEEFFSTTFVRSTVMIGDETIATCRMKLFLTDKTPDE